jgi:hypothetical protein
VLTRKEFTHVQHVDCFKAWQHQKISILRLCKFGQDSLRGVLDL